MCPRFTYDELQMIPYTDRHDVSGFESTSSELNGFLKNNVVFMRKTDGVYMLVKY